VTISKIIKGKKLLFDVKGNPELSAAIQERLIALGGQRATEPRTEVRYSESELIGWIRDTISTWTKAEFCNQTGTRSNLLDLYPIPNGKVVLGQAQWESVPDTVIDELATLLRTRYRESITSSK